MESCSALADHDFEYSRLLEALQENFKRLTAEPGVKVFTTDAPSDDLSENFIERLPADIQQVHRCSTCRNFMRAYGALVTISPEGATTPLFWPDSLPGPYALAVQHLHKVISKARVTGVFLSKAPAWGTAVTGPWRHMAVCPPKQLLHTSVVKTPGQLMAEKREDRGILCRSLAEFPLNLVEQVLPILEGDALYRSEKVLGVAKWFRELHRSIEGVKGPRKDAIIWRAVASAPPGWCHVRSTMVGTLLEDAANGLDFNAISNRFKEKMHPLQYQRPSSAPSIGNIEDAERAIEQLGVAPAFKRRFARLEDMQTVWTPEEEAIESLEESIFSHLKSKSPTARALAVPAQKITWERFRNEVLPNARKLTYKVPLRGPFIAFVTAEDPEAPPILQWDREDRRNPVSWYVYSNGVIASRFNLSSGTFVDVTAICLFPNLWDSQNPLTHHGNGVAFLLKGARDTADDSLGLFPEILRSDLHPYRKTIEAFSRSRQLSGEAEATACGVDLRRWSETFRVSLKGVSTTIDYHIDREK